MTEQNDGHVDNVAVDDPVQDRVFEPGQVTVGEFDRAENKLLDQLHKVWKTFDAQLARSNDAS